ncbi:hypothetical protein NL676_033795 [Syzygium grande]|nr:hypothetical protein NL676_033795 [Syzygium grande]
MDFRLAGFDSPLFATLHHLAWTSPDEANKSFNAPPAPSSATPGHGGHPGRRQDCLGSYAFVVDMPGLKSGDIKNANTEAVSAACRDRGADGHSGEATPPEPKKPKTVGSRSLESGLAELSYSSFGEQVLWGMKNNERMA